MYNVLIVDDEYLSRNTLRCMTDWERSGFRVAAEAKSAEEAMELLRQGEIDVVFSDVYMPGTDGIALAEQINAAYPSVPVVMMSNYSDFDSVKRAFKVNIKDYFLKHDMSRDSLDSLLERLKADLDSDVRVEHSGHNIEAEIAYRNEIKDAILKDIPSQLPGAVIFAARIEHRQLRLQTYSPQEKQYLYQNICNTIAQVVSETKGFVAFQHQEAAVLYLPFPTGMREAEIMRLCRQYLGQINYSIYKFYNIHLLWGLSRLSTVDYNVHQCYREALEMLRSFPISSKDKRLNDRDRLSAQLPIETEKTLLSAISDLDLEKIDQILEELLPDTQSEVPNEVLVGELVSILIKTCTDLHVPAADIPLLETQEPADNTSAVYLDWFRRGFHFVIEAYQDTPRGDFLDSYITSAKEYIYQNYRNNIRLSDIADHVGISKQYLCKIFKRQTGENVSKFITTYRIEKAKELLRNGPVNIKFLYNSVGFNDYNYFFVVFKKYTGYTPFEYQKKYQKKHEAQ